MAAYWKKLGTAAIVAFLSGVAAAQTAPPARAHNPHPHKERTQHGNSRPRPQHPDVQTGTARPTAATATPDQAQPVAMREQAPPPPSRPYEQTPVAPQVTYSGGQLTISAANSTLADILSAVRTRLGARVDFPQTAAQERVAVQLGPGSPRDVLAQLLHGSPFDYILLGSDQDPRAVTDILITRRQAGTTAVAAAGAQNPAPRQAEPSGDDDAENSEVATPAAPQPLAQPTPGQPVPGQPVNMAAPMQQNPEQNAPGNTQNAAPGNPQNNNQPKTPEQLLQELQRMQQQEQQRRQKPPQ
jgi:hypothetical protein